MCWNDKIDKRSRGGRKSRGFTYMYMYIVGLVRNRQNGVSMADIQRIMKRLAKDPKISRSASHRNSEFHSPEERTFARACVSIVWLPNLDNQTRSYFHPVKWRFAHLIKSLCSANRKFSDLHFLFSSRKGQRMIRNEKRVFEARKKRTDAH